MREGGAEGVQKGLQKWGAGGVGRARAAAAVCVCACVRACVRACVCVWGGGGVSGVSRWGQQVWQLIAALFIETKMSVALAANVLASRMGGIRLTTLIALEVRCIQKRACSDGMAWGQHPNYVAMNDVISPDL